VGEGRGLVERLLALRGREAGRHTKGSMARMVVAILLGIFFILSPLSASFSPSLPGFLFTLDDRTILGPCLPPSTTDRSMALLLATPLFLKLFFFVRLNGSVENCTLPTRAVRPRFTKKQLLLCERGGREGRREGESEGGKTLA